MILVFLMLFFYFLWAYIGKYPTTHWGGSVGLKESARVSARYIRICEALSQQKRHPYAVSLKNVLSIS